MRRSKHRPYNEMSRSCERLILFVEADDEGSEAVGIMKLGGELAGGGFRIEASDADAVEHAGRRIEGDDVDGRVARLQLRLQPLRILRAKERADLHAKESRRGIRSGNQIEADLSCAGANHADSLCGGIGKINDTVSDKGAAVIDAHLRLLAVGKVGDAHDGVERESTVRGSELAHVVDFAV